MVVKRFRWIDLVPNVSIWGLLVWQRDRIRTSANGFVVESCTIAGFDSPNEAVGCAAHAPERDVLGRVNRRAYITARKGSMIAFEGINEDDATRSRTTISPILGLAVGERQPDGRNIGLATVER